MNDTPPPTAFSVHIDDAAEQSVVRVVGPLLVGDSWCVRELDTATLTSPIIIDLVETTKIDVAGIAAVGALARRLIDEGKTVRIFEPVAPECIETIAMTGVFELINRNSAPVYTW